MITDLSIDLFIYLVKFLSFADTAALCACCKKFQHYGLNYKNHWKSLIERTYQNVYDYQLKIYEIQKKRKAEWNYLIYTQIIYLCDPITVATFRYQQEGLVENTDECYIALCLLNQKPNEVLQKTSDTGFSLSYPHLYMLEFEELKVSDLEGLLPIMARYGTVKGLEYIRYRSVCLYSVYPTMDSHCTNNLFHIASKFGRLDVFRYLNKTIISYAKKKCFSLAVENGHLRILEYILERTSKQEDLINQENLTQACKNGFLSILKLLLKECPNTDLHGPFLTACIYGHLLIVEYLTNLVDIRQNDDLALRFAAACNQGEIIKYLLSKGANIHANNDECLEILQRYHYSFL